MAFHFFPFLFFFLKKKEIAMLLLSHAMLSAEMPAVGGQVNATQRGFQAFRELTLRLPETLFFPLNSQQ